MSYVAYALFPSRSEAQAAIETLKEARLISDDQVQVFTHEGQIDRPADLVESDARRGIPSGILRGAILGGLTLGVAAAFGITYASLTTMVALGLVTGAIIGGLSAALVSISALDRDLKRLASHMAPGRVLMTFKSLRKPPERRAIQVARSHGAQIIERPA